MSAIFEDMMTGLNEVDAFLAGQTTGYKVSVPAEVNVKVIRQRLNMTLPSLSDEASSHESLYQNHD